MKHLTSEDILHLIKRAKKHLKEGQKELSLQCFDELYNDYKMNEEFDHLVELADLSMQLQQFTQRIDILSSLVSEEPENPLFLDQLAVSYMKTNRFQEAYSLLKRALESDPDCVSALINISSITTIMNEHKRSIEHLERAYPYAKDNPNLLINLSNAYNHIGEYKKALDFALQALKYEKSSMTYNTVATLYAQLGEISNSIKYYQHALEKDHTNGDCFFGIATQTKFKNPDDRFFLIAENALLENMKASDRSLIHFALGKAYNDIGSWDIAFTHFQKGNLLKKPATKPVQPSKLCEKVRAYCTKKNLSEYLENGANPSSTPIFILGMPRSGSTLIEQIISSHPQANSIGESDIISRFANEIFIGKKSDSEMIQALSKTNLTRYADEYLTALYNRTNSTAKRIINKAPGNHMFIGFILTLFPNAKFIHTIRNPLDTCFSCYMQPFTYIHWANDFHHLADAYRFYRSNIDFWKNNLPEGIILDVNYEDMLSDSEKQSRRLLEFCELDWNPNCLQFFNKTEDQSIRTASLWQVRQPIYSSSKQRWQKYVSHLDILARELNPYLSCEDLQFLTSNGIEVSAKPFLGLKKINPSSFFSFRKKSN